MTNIFENQDIVFEVFKNLNPVDSFNALETNKTFQTMKTIKDFEDRLNLNKYAAKIQNRFRFYLDKVDFIEGLTNHQGSIEEMTEYIDWNLCIVPIPYRNLLGEIGCLLGDIRETYGIMLEHSMLEPETQEISYEQFNAFNEVIDRYIW